MFNHIKANKIYLIKKYTDTYKESWDDFVANSKNATFLFQRDFMEYHADRFEDFSLMVFKDDTLIAVFPGNRVASVLYSHQGLSYGGLVLPKKINFNDVLESVKTILKFISENGIVSCVIKQLPKMYHLLPADEMEFILFILKAKLLRRDMASVVRLGSGLEYATLRKRQIKKATAKKLRYQQEHDFTTFWEEVLTPNLKQSYGLDPVHSLVEIANLKNKFPNHIKQYNVYFEDELLAGCTVFETPKVAHVQYVSTKKENDLGALDFLMDKLINEVYVKKEYFDFGISNENNGKNINEGLYNWKQGFGASPMVHDFYEFRAQDYLLLNSVLK